MSGSLPIAASGSGFSGYYAGNTSYCSDQYLNSSNGTIADGSGANQYANNQSCTWYLSNSFQKRYTLDFTTFNTETNKDIVYIYDGPYKNSNYLIATFSGSALPPSITSSGSNITIFFATDWQNTDAGWALNYTTSSIVYCGTSTLTGSSGSFSDGSPFNYLDNTQCSWLIKPANPLNYIVLTFTAFALESCCDYVTIYNGSTTSAPVLGRFYGSQFPDIIYGSSNTMLVTFYSDVSQNYNGWEANYYTSDFFSGYCQGVRTITARAVLSPMEVEI